MSTVNPAEVIAEALAEALAEHNGGFIRNDGDWQCRCGAVEVTNSNGGALVAHQASVIAALPDIAIVPLETPEFFEWADGAQTQVWNGPLQTVQTWPGAQEIILRDDFEHSVSVADVARQGAMFIAAARAAGVES